VETLQAAKTLLASSRAACAVKGLLPLQASFHHLWVAERKRLSMPLPPLPTPSRLLRRHHPSRRTHRIVLPASVVQLVQLLHHSTALLRRHLLPLLRRHHPSRRTHRIVLPVSVFPSPWLVQCTRLSCKRLSNTLPPLSRRWNSSRRTTRPTRTSSRVTARCKSHVSNDHVCGVRATCPIVTARCTTHVSDSHVRAVRVTCSMVTCAVCESRVR
jgi:hypothetical protein